VRVQPIERLALRDIPQPHLAGKVAAQSHVHLVGLATQSERKEKRKKIYLQMYVAAQTIDAVEVTRERGDERLGEQLAQLRRV
jgi:hypothetical protein